MKKLLLCIMIGMFLISFVVAEQQSLGTFKKDSEIQLMQSCENSSYSNVSKIIHPNGTILLSTQVIMDADNDDYNLTFTNTSDIGTYVIYGHCDEDGVKANWVYDMEINAIGFESTDARSAASNRGTWFLFGVAVLFFLAFIFTKAEETIFENNGMVRVKNKTVLKWTWFILSVLFLTLGTNVTFISIYNEIGDTQIGAIFDKAAMGSLYLFYFSFGILLFIWVYATIATLADRTRMKQAEAVGLPTNFYK